MESQAAHPPSLRLSLWKQHLGRVPDWVWERTDLEMLVLAENELTEVSGQIAGLKKLGTLDLGYNRLTSIPDELGDLDGLTDFLYLHDNQLTGLPEPLAKLTKLRYLNISDNRLAELPGCVLAMARLVELRASGNQMTSLPRSIDRLECLRELHLRDNRIALLPDSIGAMQQLRHIDLRGNPIQQLPASIALLPRLEKLDLRWVDIPPCEWFAALEARGCLVYR